MQDKPFNNFPYFLYLTVSGHPFINIRSHGKFGELFELASYRMVECEYAGVQEGLLLICIRSAVTSFGPARHNPNMNISEEKNTALAFYTKSEKMKAQRSCLNCYHIFFPMPQI